MNITAGYVFTQDDDELIVVGFADNKYNTNKYVLLQRTRNPSAAEIELGHDKVHITVNDQLNSGYGFIELFELVEHSANITLSEAVLSELNIDMYITVDFSEANIDLSYLCRKLRLLFEKETSIFIDRTS